MLDRCTEISGFYVCDVGEDRLEVVDGQFQRHNRRRGVVGEGRSDVHDLGEGRMRVEGVERLKTLVPVVKGFQQGERRGGADGFHPVAVVDHVAAATMQQGEFFTGEGVAFEDGFGFGDILFAVGDEQQGVVGLEGFDGVATDLGTQPFAEFIAVLGVLIALRTKVPSVVGTGKNRRAVASGDQFSRGGFTGCDEGDADAVFQGEARQQMAEKASVDQLGWRAETKTAFLRETAEWQENVDEYRKSKAGQFLSSVVGESVMSLGVAA